MIRGGSEYGLGIYITGVDEQSKAEKRGLKPGDEIVEVNGIRLANLTHDDAVRLLQYSKCLRMTIKSVNKMPHSSMLNNGSKSSSNSTLASHWTPVKKNNYEESEIEDFDLDSKYANLTDPLLFYFMTSSSDSYRRRRNRSLQSTFLTDLSSQHSSGSTHSSTTGAQSAAAAAATFTSDTPELSMVLEKAFVLLDGDDFSRLGVLLEDYGLKREIDIDEFAGELARMLLGDDDKVSLIGQCVQYTKVSI